MIGARFLPQLLHELADRIAHAGDFAVARRTRQDGEHITAANALGRETHAAQPA